MTWFESRTCPPLQLTEIGSSCPRIPTLPWQAVGGCLRRVEVLWIHFFKHKIYNQTTHIPASWTCCSRQGASSLMEVFWYKSFPLLGNFRLMSAWLMQSPVNVTTTFTCIIGTTLQSIGSFNDHIVPALGAWWMAYSVQISRPQPPFRDRIEPWGICWCSPRGWPRAPLRNCGPRSSAPNWTRFPEIAFRSYWGQRGGGFRHCQEKK